MASQTSGKADQQALDRRFMAAALRLSRRNAGRTSTNPSVGTIIVRDDGAGPMIVGTGVTAVGGRPHAETEALTEAGELARGATAYVTLEPCAHHGRTPPCANALVNAGVARVVGAASDPDPRVSGKGYAILRAAGIEVVEKVLVEEAAEQMAGYLIRSMKKRPEVTLKLALSSDGKIGRHGAGQVAITGDIARREVYLMRAEADGILVGIGTALEDDPALTVRLPGLENRSPAHIVLDRQIRLPEASKLVSGTDRVPLYVAASLEADPLRRSVLERAGVRFIGTETHEGGVALPELLEDLGALGMASVLVEGGAKVASAFLAEGLIDRIVLFQGPEAIGEGGIASPIDANHIPAGFRKLREMRFGEDSYAEWVRDI
ncbi:MULTISPECIES: bifunctional diaminohydroxyphosphoribosylaminopyrimidine deaminase/5-amino-6-(5-phosphoribosylamino)uracil reductase RibD [unclassified Mesorhizobium]|uniref:bifunctional diaminohydroxyphosphoribosylaminopyrimidine deaminase/5-amino-6-(5-phosphoribosylamino)uracil reductase RibD n=1 Tax=unclassified Mesorhizobium TaxID=325217 RepID=UPI0003CEFBC6|nr:MULTISPECIES: bifunctional diaminohydroxyphosphoribosylaminopyrimidine deaminase/5-amino-6-(5-phosphoribosylamino)uracil reductase RibD [unclassified Mesorhizobium]ESX24524.1 5-amino-6-(5-phosphoribosylamino)uracil reductase [Mesorhizobium sp. LSHC440B00]ESX33338.1 5-amino-6-(5-phosphoribosylamino)uracil reductase [Mesorhizobium sp. LSHC432A00]ESX36734.1 5-amino-6-(5-phosphoribosylamino)uracil reductase [Mesorhizobium sp. LSHC440A00]ESY14837.1 5-amino-6-(5-phosphoribosylamino)uracil reductas